MRFVYFTLLFIGILSFLGLIVIGLLRYLNKEWWKNKIIRWSTYGLVLFGWVAIVIWSTGFRTGNRDIANIGSTLTVVALTVILGLIISLPFSGLFNRLAKVRKKEEVNQSRRKILKSTAVLFPTVAVGLSGTGLTSAHSDARMETLKFKFDDLPDQLDGLRILQLSDTHLGIYKDLDDLEQLISDASDKNPDIVLFTGDISDDLRILPDALKIISSLKTKYGTFASLGNHEYYRGIEDVLRIIGRSEIPLLRNSGTNLNINGADLYISGSDDPRTMGENNNLFLQKSIESALDGAPSEAFHLTMSHRPEALDPASELGVDLVLSGHTHGGQVGLGDRSFFSIFMPDRYRIRL